MDNARIDCLREHDGMDTTTTPVAGALTVGIAGASGRMGRQLIAEATGRADFDVVAAWVGDRSGSLAQPVAGTRLSYTPTGHSQRPPQVVIDFSHAGAFDQVLEWCRRERVALVSGTTGLTDAQQVRMSEASAAIPVLWSANFSLGVAVLSQLVAEAARALPDWDAEIVEAHHAGKRDAPSGTALALGRELAGARGHRLDERAVFDRHDRDRPRQAGEIGFATLRAGDIVGEHTVVLAAAGERLELGHRATDRAIFARGALHAARWLAGREQGLYRLEHTLA